MLNIVRVKNNDEKQSIFADFDPDQSTWLVSDLKTKLEIQNRMLSHHPLLEENSVLRASELWNKWIKQFKPEIKIVSNDLLRCYLSEQLQNEKLNWAKTPGAAKSLLAYLNQLVPFMLHPDGDEILKSWFEDHSGSYVKWGHWYHLSRKFWEHFNQNNICTPQWIAAMLTLENLEVVHWDRQLIVDLGCEISPVEVEVFKKLSSSINVTIIQPDPSWSNGYTSSLWPYKLFSDEAIEFDKMNDSFSADHLKKWSHVAYKKYATSVAEVKDSVSQAREWLEQGVDPKSISILAPDIEEYWPTLHSYLKIEGVPASKSKVSRLTSYTELSQWMSDLSLHMKKIKSAHLEHAIYDESKSQPLSYDLFRRLFKNIYDETDLQRHPYIEKLFSSGVDQAKVLSRDEFILMACRFVKPHRPLERIEGLISRFYQDTFPALKMSFYNWFNFLNGLASRIEINIEPGSSGAIQVENLSSGEWLGATHVIILGATESDLCASSEIGLSSNEVLSINQQTGFSLQIPNLSRPEFELQWVLTGAFAKTVLCTSSTRFSGSVEAPSKIWLSGALSQKQNPECFTEVMPTREDELQLRWRSLLKINSDLDLRSEFKLSEKSFSSIQRDIYSTENFTPNVATNEVDSALRLSASQVEGYLKCPFVFAAKKLFKLSDLPDLDLDIDHMTKGQLMHALFERLTEEPIQVNVSEKEIGELLEEIKSEDSLNLGDESVWVAVKKQHVELAKRFLKFESQWREDFPETKTEGREEKVEGYWNMEARSLSDKGEFPFLGFIDRIDRDEKGNVAVIDYKSSAAQARNWSSWVVNDSLQLGIYVQAVEKGLTQLGPSKVVAANYFVSKTMDRKKGFNVKSSGSGLISEKQDRFIGIESDQLENLISDTNELFASAVDGIVSGSFSPRPKEMKSCSDCRWQKICRAKHLQ